MTREELEPFLNDLLAPTPLLTELTRDDRTEGNLFERNDGDGRIAQLQIMYETITRLKPKRILEVGTNKGFFGYLLTLLLGDDFELITCDIDEKSQRAVDKLKTVNPRICLVLGDSRETLAKIHFPFDLMWLDGGHQFEFALSDIKNGIRMKIPTILIDDTSSHDVKKAIDESGITDEYRLSYPVSYWHDHRKIMVAERK